jgi:hypothetical protein
MHGARPKGSSNLNHYCRHWHITAAGSVTSTEASRAKNRLAREYGIVLSTTPEVAAVGPGSWGHESINSSAAVWTEHCQGAHTAAAVAARLELHVDVPHPLPLGTGDAAQACTIAAMHRGSDAVPQQQQQQQQQHLQQQQLQQYQLQQYQASSYGGVEVPAHSSSTAWSQHHQQQQQLQQPLSSGGQLQQQHKQQQQQQQWQQRSPSSNYQKQQQQQPNFY